MKKFLALMLACLLVGQFVCMTASAEENTPYRPFLEVVQEVGTYRGDLEDLRYFPFQYTNDDDFAWFRDNVIGPNECEEGVLYVKDLVEETIWPVTDEPVTAYKELGTDLVYAIGNDIFKTDYFCNRIHLYTANESITQMAKEANAIYFAENNHIKLLQVNTGLVEDLFACDDIATFAVNSIEEIVWSDHTGNLFQYDFTTGKAVSLEVPPVIEIGYDSCIVERHTDNEEISTRVAAVPISLPLAEYPVGSYFSTSGSPCTHHGNCIDTLNSGRPCGCRVYDGGIQCRGFAKYASDQYAHRSSWTTPAGDKRSNVVFTEDSDVKVFFSSLSYGAYVALLSSVYSDHCIVVLSTDSKSVRSYECNNDGHCGVSLNTRPFSEFVKYYNKVDYSISHSFNGTVRSRTSQFHSISCSTSGCSGYILEVHYSSNPGSNATCKACGYVGKIDAGVLQSLPRQE